MTYRHHRTKRRKKRKRRQTLKMRGGRAKDPNMAEKAGQMGAKTAVIAQAVAKNARKQVLDMGTGAAKKGKRLWNKIRRSVKGQILSATDKLIPTYTKKEVDQLEKKISNKAAKVGADGLEAGGNIVKNIHTNPKLQRQAKRLVKSSLAAAKDGAEELAESAGNLSGPAMKAAKAAGGVVKSAADAAVSVGVGVVKEAAFAVPGVADVYNLGATGLELGDQVVKGATKAGEAATEGIKLVNAVADEAIDLPEDTMAGIKKVKKLATSVTDLAEDALASPKKGGSRKRKRRRKRKRSDQGGGGLWRKRKKRATRRKRRRRHTRGPHRRRHTRRSHRRRHRRKRVTRRR